MYKNLSCLLVLMIISCYSLYGQLSRRPYWGASFSEFGQKVKISRLVEDYSFHKAGFELGDVIISLNNEKILDQSHLRKLLKNKKQGDKINALVERNGKEINIEIITEAYPYEKLEGVDFEYDFFVSQSGDSLRTVISKPSNVNHLPAILFIQWLSCDDIDKHPVYPDGNVELIHALSKAGYLVMRTEKPGVGDSKGRDCGDYGFDYELQLHQEALEILKKRKDVDPNNIFLMGSSMGGSMVPIIAQNQKLRGLIVTGCFYKTWYEHMLEIERRISQLSGDSPSVTNSKMNQWSKFYSLYLNDHLTPQQIIAKYPEYNDLWIDDPEHQYGRPVSFYMEVNNRNIADYWSKLSIPTLVIYGEYDWIMSKEDHLMIVEDMNKRHENMATYLEMPKVGHGLTQYNSLQESFNSPPLSYDHELSNKVVNWIHSITKK